MAYGVVKRGDKKGVTRWVGVGRTHESFFKKRTTILNKNIAHYYYEVDLGDWTGEEGRERQKEDGEDETLQGQDGEHQNLSKRLEHLKNYQMIRVKIIGKLTVQTADCFTTEHISELSFA